VLLRCPQKTYSVQETWMTVPFPFADSMTSAPWAAVVLPRMLPRLNPVVILAPKGFPGRQTLGRCPELQACRCSRFSAGNGRRGRIRYAWQCYSGFPAEWGKLPFYVFMSKGLSGSSIWIFWSRRIAGTYFEIHGRLRRYRPGCPSSPAWAGAGSPGFSGFPMFRL